MQVNFERRRRKADPQAPPPDHRLGSIASTQELKTHLARLYRFCYGRMHSHQDTEDIVQETFLKLSKLKDARGIENLMPMSVRWPAMPSRIST